MVERELCVCVCASVSVHAATQCTRLFCIRERVMNVCVDIIVVQMF